MEFLSPAEAGYFTNAQWESAFRAAFETLRGDRPRAKASSRVRVFATAFGFSQSRSFKNNNRPNLMTQEGSNVKVR